MRGTVHVPGDKSVSHRAAMFAAIANGESKISNFSASADCASTIACLRELGVDIERAASDVTVRGSGLRGLKRPSRPLDCGNSGTTMRLLSGILAGQEFESELVGDESLSTRPMRRVIDPLTLMGARIDSNEGRAPLIISGGRLKAIEYRPPVASAQIKSCVLLAGLLADGTTTVIEPVPTRDHTERMLEWLGANISVTSGDDGVKRVSIVGGSELSGRDLSVPGDISAAAFFMAAGAALPGSEISIPNIGLNPSRTGVLSAMRSLGAKIEVANERQASGEPVGDLLVKGGLESASRDDGNVLRGEIIANVIDEIPILAVFGTQLPGGLEIRDAAELRVKESDRISAVVENLQRMGADVVEYPDGLKVNHSRLAGAQIDSFGDHRIAMAFAVAAMFADGETEIVGADAVDVSFPGFFDELDKVTVEAGSR